MRSNHILLIAVILFTVLCACSKKQESEPASPKQEDTPAAVTETTTASSEADAEDTEEASEADDEGGSPLSYIQKHWSSLQFPINPRGTTPGIKQFALAFVTYYPAFNPNAALIDYITSPKNYNPENKGCAIDDQERHGYLRSSAMSQFSMETACCYWKRQNGHQLVAFWMLDEHENAEDDCRVAAFYDYDPKADLMKPEPALTDMVEQIAKDFDSYEVKLPIQGKDIEVICYRHLEDSAEPYPFLMKWNGQTFDAPKKR